jgi:hypothetical protein
MASSFDALGAASTIGGVALGAVMATLGSFAANHYERHLLRREREADAALLFGELLRTLSILIGVVRTVHARGDPFGSITIRFIKAVRREVDIYDRNRERLFTVRDAELRPRASTVMARLTFALDRILDNTEALAASLPEAERDELIAGRALAFDFMVESADELPELVESFAALTNSRLADFDLARAGYGRPPRSQQSSDGETGGEAAAELS